ncbi:hypothetical protein [Halosimplex sp. TS25]|uniref:hypothetical protein n=1 Tax=Halosimplex rarum TaxID=3396619 RepID=UPI0039E8657B
MDEYQPGVVDGRNSGTDGRRLGRLLLLVGSPILLAAAFAAHPHGGADLVAAGDATADWWFRYHLVLLPLLGLLGVCLFVLLADFDGTTATVGRAGTAVYGVCYVAFEAIAGIAVGIVLHEGEAFSGVQQEAATAIAEGIGTNPAVVALALIGTAGGLVAVIAVGILYRRAGAPLAPVFLLGGAPLAMVGHGGGHVDVVGTLLFLVGVAWLELRWSGPDGEAAETAP